MLKAHSLLYAVYVCLIVSILCGALLYYASLYNQLNLFYNSNEELYIQNQSVVNYALGNGILEQTSFEEDTSFVKSEIESKRFGLLNLLIVKSFNKSDTITSAHFVGKRNTLKTSIYLSSISKPLTYSGAVKLIGDKKLPSPNIEVQYISNESSNLISRGKIELSGSLLPDINSNFKTIFETNLSKLKSLKDVERINDSVYFNSFLNETIEIELPSSILENIVIKGNFILHSKDSIQIRKSTVLEDVILKAPQISFNEGFSGNLQAFATEKIKVNKSVVLHYPSILCLYNTSNNVTDLVVDEKSKIYGAIVLFGTPVNAIDNNKVILNKNSLLIGDLYCSGKVMIEGVVLGSVFTNRFFHKTNSSIYENCIGNGEIDNTKKPSYFVSIPLFEEKNTTYEVYKKAL